MMPSTTDPTPDWNPRWSPDGSQIAFYAYRSGNRDVWVMPARGGAARQVTSHPAFDWFPAWSPDGREIAFSSQREGEPTTWVVAASGGGPRRLTPGDVVDWSPDGQWLVVGGRGGFRRVSRDGRQSAPLATGAHRPNSPRFSHDGRSVYYSVIEGPPDHLGVWRLSLADGAITRLTRLEGQHGRLGYYYAADARYLYITWNEDDADLWVMDVAPSGAR